MARSNGVPYRVIDAHERIVFFESIARKKKDDVYIAKNTEGNEGYYRVRHRPDGPAMISKDGARRWFINGVEKTLDIERALKSIESPFKENAEFQLTEKSRQQLKAMLVNASGKPKLNEAQ